MSKQQSMIVRSVLPVILAATATANPVSKLGGEWWVPSTGSPSKATLVDSASGAVRVLQMSSSGKVIWPHTVATGVSEVSDVCGGLSAATGEAVAVTSPWANRVMLVDVDAAAPMARALPALNGVGPSGVVASLKGGTLECVVVSALNGSVAARMESHQNVATTGTLAATGAFSSPFRRLQPLANPAAPADRVAFYTATSGSQTFTGTLVRSGASMERYGKNTFEGVFEFVPSVRDVNGAAGQPLILGYSAGSNAGRILKVDSSLTAALSFTSTSVVFPFAVASVVPILAAAGPLSDGFLALAADGTQAAWLRINATGTALVSTGQVFAPAPGTVLSGLLPFPGLGLVKLGAAVAGGVSTSYTAWQWNGSAWVQSDAGELPELPVAGLASGATLLFYDKNPGTDESAILLGMRALPDWTRPLSFPDPFPATVKREVFVSAATGLAFSSNQTVSPPPGATHVLTNQLEPALSVAALASPADLFAPPLRVEPPSGVLRRSVQVTANYDNGRQELLWRDENAGAWQAWSGPVGIASTRSLQFVLRSISSGVMGPVIRRSYTMAAADMAVQDSDRDGVPDYVESQAGLDPFGGPDDDGDGWSDLDEFIRSTSPASSASTPPAGASAGIAVQGGWRIAATAFNHAGLEIANGEEIRVHAIDGSLLDGKAVAAFGFALPDGSTRGALLESATPRPADEVVLLSSPRYFDVTTLARSGREAFAFIDSPPPMSFRPAFTPTGLNLATDSAAWIAAAQSAAATLPVATARTSMTPADTGVAALLEDLVQRSLAALKPVGDPAPALDGFSLFGGRDGDRGRVLPDAADLDLLKSAGFDFRLALDQAATVRSALEAACVQIVARHAATSATNPAMVMPLDAMRAILRGGAAPAGYESAVSSANRNAAVAAYAAAVAGSNACLRPMATWTVEVLAAPPEAGVYRRVPGANDIVLLDAAGERIRLEQGLGLRPGSRFTVSGFTDTADDGAWDSIEVVTAVLADAPASSDRDLDGNLLDDAWEHFFFGVVGQDPFSKPGPSGHTLVQYFLEGIDPRGGLVPVAAPTTPGPSAVVFSKAAAAYHLEFSFPNAYLESFEFVLERSDGLSAASFVGLSSVVPTVVGPGRLRFVVPAAAAAGPRGFFRVRARLRGTAG